MRGVKRKEKHLQIHSISQIQQTLCFKIVLKDPSYSEIYAFLGRIFRSTPLPKIFLWQRKCEVSWGISQIVRAH